MSLPVSPNAVPGVDVLHPVEVVTGRGVAVASLRASSEKTCLPPYDGVDTMFDGLSC